MFKTNSGRKQESNIWKYFKYDASSNKSICIVQTKKDNDMGDAATCGQQLMAKNASNLKYHMRSQHKTEFAEFDNSERHRKQPQDKGHTTQQTKLTVQVEQVCEIEQSAVVYPQFFSNIVNFAFAMQRGYHILIMCGVLLVFLSAMM
jgi:DNA-binding PucR family transcriptional regulator